MKTRAIMSGFLGATLLLGASAMLPQSAEAGQGFCPPGLAKKGCVPPGQQKFHHGDRIPHGTHYDYFDYRRYDLPHPKHGHRYIRIGREAYLIAEGTQRVIEAINLFDAASD